MKKYAAFLLAIRLTASTSEMLAIPTHAATTQEVINAAKPEPRPPKST